MPRNHQHFTVHSSKHHHHHHHRIVARKKRSWWSIPTVYWVVLVGALLLVAVRNNEGAIRQLPQGLAPFSTTTASSSSSLSPLSQLELVVTTFPDNGKFEELETTLLKSLAFLWPGPLNMTVVLDDCIIHQDTPSQSAQYWNHQIQSLVDSLSPQESHRVRVAWNPLCNTTLYGPGWSIQQLVMLWADNFTSAPWIGFVDDDTIVTKAVQEYDLFDDQGRPRAIVRYQAVGGPHGNMTLQQHRKSYEAFREPSFIYAMSYFPVIVRRAHLPGIRQAMLDAHPEFEYFDQLFQVLFPHTMFSQFMLMMDHLWRHHRDEYAWHFEPFRWNRPHTTHLPREIHGGAPHANGVTPAMRQPFPRCMMHANYMADARKTPRAQLVQRTLQAAYCASLPLNDTDDERCHQLDFNNYYIIEWGFEELLYGYQWPVYDPDGVHRAHEARRARNQPRQWRKDLLDQVFG